MNTFALRDILNSTTAAQRTLLTGALKIAYEHYNMGEFKKQKHPDTGYKCNYYDIFFKDAVLNLYKGIEVFEQKENRHFTYAQEKIDLMRKYFFSQLNIEIDLNKYYNELALFERNES